MASNLTVVIPTLNEELDIENCLKSVKDIAHEILVVDSGSTDRTLEIAKKFKAKIISYDFKSFSDTRNFADDNSSGDWILSIEADVTVSKELGDEITKEINTTKNSAFKIGRVNNIWGKDILHTDWGPKDDTHIWLYKKGSGKWVGGVHEEFVTNGAVGKLKNYLFHINYRTISEFISKINKYSDVAIRDKVSVSKFACIKDFFKRYFYKKGFLDGYHGLFLSYLQSIYHLTLFVKQKTR